MALFIAILFFSLLFACEGIYHLSCQSREEASLCRYRIIEHPRRHSRDRYLDIL